MDVENASCEPEDREPKKKILKLSSVSKDQNHDAFTIFFNRVLERMMVVPIQKVACLGKEFCAILIN
jgi:hypothetical protein